MADPIQLNVIRQGVEVWNQWRKDNRILPSLERADLHKVDLRGANLKTAFLQEADLSGSSLADANLFGATLYDAKLHDANLSRANLEASDLTAARLLGAYLRGANLRGSTLRATNFQGADLHEADLYDADLMNTVFGDTNLEGAIGLESCNHLGPSLLDFSTLARSGPLPLLFLRGCGLPDKLIDYLPSLLNEPIQFYSCFISYSTEDQQFAERLHADLQDKGVRCWFAPHQMQGGKKIHEQIDEAIRVYDRLLLIVSPHSMGSRWVKTEIANARTKELAQGRKVLFPVRLVDFHAIRQWKLFDADIGDDSAGEIREYFIPDFSNWENHDSYKQAFQRLLSDLKAETGPRA
jgi:hypothetical protein